MAMTMRALLLMLVAGAAFAGTADLSWVNPTQNTDGSAIPATGADSLASTKVEWFQCTAITSTWPATPSTATVPKPATTYQVTGLTNGLRYCFRVFAVNTAGNTSGPSAVGDKLIPAGTPNPPVLTVAVVVGMNMAPVFKLTSTGKRSAEVAGYIPTGELCSGNVLFRYRDLPFRSVSADKVLFWSVVPSQSVAAPCA